MMNYEGRKGELQIKEAVYRIDPKTAKLDLVNDELFKPNGLCFSPDYKRLYIADTGGPAPMGIQVFDVVDERRLLKGRRFCSMELAGKRRAADGTRADGDGTIGGGAGGAGEGSEGAPVSAPEAQRIGQTPLRGICSTVCFGGPKRNRLFMTASQSLYAVYVETQGAH